MAVFCRRYIPRYSHIVKPLTDLLSNSTEWRWGKDESEASDTIKRKMTEAPVLKQPVPDKTFTLITDASKQGLGAVLCQEDEKHKLQPVAYISRKLNDAETRYTTREMEGVAIYWAIGQFSPFLLGRKFTVQTGISRSWHFQREEDTPL